MSKAFIGKIFVGLLILLVIAYAGLRLFAPTIVEKSQNTKADFERHTVTANVRDIHNELFIMDWHTDSLLWNRDLLERADYGHVDIPRAQAGNIGLIMFTAVTKSPSDLNYEQNTADDDTITSLSFIQGWPISTWNSLFERALYQVERLKKTAARSKGTLVFIDNQKDLESFLARREEYEDVPRPVGALMGAEGAHPLEGNIDNIQRLFDAGYRMMGITHFFDNELSGSLHSTSNAGLTDFGREAIKKFDEVGMIIDLAHISEAGAWQVLDLSTRAPVVSHTGFKGHCDRKRNFPDDLMKAIAAKGGLIAVGYWEEAACGDSPEAIAQSILYGINLVGVDHIALGSDWDGGTRSLAANELPLITEALLKQGLSEDDLAKITGENSLRFLGERLPE